MSMIIVDIEDVFHNTEDDLEDDTMVSDMSGADLTPPYDIEKSVLEGSPVFEIEIIGTKEELSQLPRIITMQWRRLDSREERLDLTVYDFFAYDELDKIIFERIVVTDVFFDKIVHIDSLADISCFRNFYAPQSISRHCSV